MGLHPSRSPSQIVRALLHPPVFIRHEAARAVTNSPNQEAG